MLGRITRRTVIENVFTLLSARAFGQIAIAIVLLLAARALGAQYAGQYIATFALAKLTSVLFELGMDGWLLKEGGKNPDQLGELVSRIIFAKLMLGLLWILGLWLISSFLNNETYPTNLLLIAALATWFESVSQSLTTGFTSTLSNRTTASLSLSYSLLLTASTIALLLIRVDTPIPFAIIRLAVGALTFFGGLLWLSRDQQLILVPKSISKTITAARPFFFSEALSVIYTQAGITLVALMLGSYSAGVYGPAIRIVIFLFLIPFSVFSVMVPVLSNFHQEDDRRLMSTIRQLLIAMAILGGVLWVLTGLMGSPIVELLLGKEFAESGQLLLLLSGIIFIRAISFGAASILVAVGLQLKRVFVQSISAMMNLILGVALIATIGLRGAAIAYIFSEILLVAGYLCLTFQWIAKQNMQGSQT